MVEPDLAVSGAGQRRGDRRALPQPLVRIRQRAFVDLALVTLERRDMGIAEHCDPVGLQPQRLLDRIHA